MNRAISGRPTYLRASGFGEHGAGSRSAMRTPTRSEKSGIGGGVAVLTMAKMARYGGRGFAKRVYKRFWSARLARSRPAIGVWPMRREPLFSGAIPMAMSISRSSRCRVSYGSEWTFSARATARGMGSAQTRRKSLGATRSRCRQQQIDVAKSRMHPDFEDLSGKTASQAQSDPRFFGRSKLAN
jgi:hypothetical protein